MNGYKIDVVAQKVIPIQVEKLEDMQQVVGGLITVATYLDNEDCVFVDDEGLMKDIRGAFEITGGHQPFVGNGLVVGTTPDGDSSDVKTAIDDLRRKITFLNPFELALKCKLGGL